MTLAAGDTERHPTRLRVKSCALDGEAASVIGTRLTALSPRSPEAGDVPTRMVLLNDALTGALIGIVDERWSFAVRTGGSAVLALKYLAPKNTHTVGIIGAGQVGRGAAYTVPAALPLVRRILVTDPMPGAGEQLANLVREQHGGHTDLEVTVLASPEAVLAAADAVVIATTAPDAFVRSAWLRPGCTVCSLGGEPEVDLDAYALVDKLVVDDWDGVRNKRDMRTLIAEGTLDRSKVHADYLELVSGQKPGRERPDERILVRLEGLAIMDTAVSYHLCQKAAAQGVGQRLVV